MADLINSNRIILTGKIVGIYEKDGVHYAKIHYDQGFVDVILQEVNDVSLNDSVTVNSKLEIEDITTRLSGASED